MEILYLDEIDSTHKHLASKLKSNSIKTPFALLAKKQTNGIGSRGDEWESFEGNFFLSISLDLDSLPKDLPKVSIAIYFSMLMQMTLEELGSLVWVKWPNDFYIDDKKAGGAIGTIIEKNVLFSIGLNLKKAPLKFATIDINIDPFELLQKYILKIKQDIFWKEIFIKYKIQFKKARAFSYYDQKLQKRVSLQNATLLEDATIQIDKKRILSLR